MMTNETVCQTCKHPRGAHWRSYDEQTVGCSAPNKRRWHCPCQGFMLTESETLRNDYLALLGMQTFEDVRERFPSPKLPPDQYTPEWVKHGE